MAVVALVAALAGSAIALPGKNSVKKNDLAKNSVVSKAIKNNKVKGVDVKESSLGTVPSAARAGSAGAVDTLRVSGLKRVNATAADTYDEAQEAAPEVPLLSKGPLTVYGKCITENGGGTYAEVYVRTTQAGSVFSGNQTALVGDDFLNPDTDEDDRWVSGSSAGGDGANGFRNIFDAVAPDGTILQGFLTTYAKNGDISGSEGLYGDGDVCLFGASAIG